MIIPSQPQPGDLLDLARQLALDSKAAPSTLRHRDRPIGQDLARHRSRPVQQILGWLQRLRESGDLPRGRQLDILHRVGLLLLGAVGLLSGWGAAAVVFFYDGSHPVNVIHVLAVFVLMPILLLLFFVFSLLPRRILRFVPGLGALQEGLALLNPGRVLHLLRRYLPQSQRETLGMLLGRGDAHRLLYGKVDRWVMVRASQFFAVAFHLGAVGSCLYRITFSDLAFSWSTTLQLNALRLKQWTDLLSTPWAFFFAAARPGLELIETTRYFRLGEGSFPESLSPSGLGGWWPFLVMCMLIYGLLPRLLTLGLARTRLKTALRQSFLQYPGVEDLLARLNAELVETAAEEAESDGETSLPGAGASSLQSADLAGRPASVILWSKAVEDRPQFESAMQARRELKVSGWFEAGGGRSLKQDAEAIEATIAGEAQLLVVIKAWEPPMAEFMDFLRALREAAGKGRMISVMPIGQAGTGGLVSPTDLQKDLWSRQLAGLGDPWLGLIFSAEENS